MVKHVSRILLQCLVFITPFVFVQNTNELFEFPKMYFVYLVGSTLVMVSIVMTNKSDVFKADFSKLLGLFVGSFIVSTIFSAHLYTSVWGYFSRFDGGLISILIFFGIYWSTKRIQPSTPQILRIVALTVLPISVYAILQHFGLGGKWESDTTTRAFSTFGQPNWYSAYCAMVLPIILYLGLEEKIRWISKVGWLLLFIFGFSGFWYSYSVSGILGLTVSMCLLLAFNFDAVKRSWSTLVVVTSICLLFAFLNPGIFKQKINDAFTDTITPLLRVDKIDTVTQAPAGFSVERVGGGRDDGSGYAVTDSGFIRKGIWRGALNLAISSPKTFLIGTGPETFPYEFQKFRPASLNYSSEWNYILNKPHNYYLELLTQNGIIGLVIYLAIVIKVLLTKHRFLAPALFGLFITNIFSWPTVSTSLLFWVFLALLTIDGGDGKGRRPEKLSPERFEGPFPSRLIMSILIITGYIFLNVQFAKQYLADTVSKKSQKYFEQGDVQKALECADKSVKLNPKEPFYYRTRAKTYILQTTGQNINATNSLKALALKDMLRARELNPQNLATLRGLVSLYYFLSLKDISSATVDPFYLGMTQYYYKNLSTNYPTDVGVLVLVAKYQNMLGFTVDYQNTIGQIKTLRPDLLDWYLK
ncbi:MAG: O-antigen ligase family protein [Patescibacteria group bacterium]